MRNPAAETLAKLEVDRKTLRAEYKRLCQRLADAPDRETQDRLKSLRGKLAAGLTRINQALDELAGNGCERRRK